MKNNIYIYTFLIFIFFISKGCDSNINLDPEGIISAESYFSTIEDYENALNTVYSRINYDNYNLWLDGVTDDAIVTHSWNSGYDLGRGFGSSSSSFPRQMWNSYYKGVQWANEIIANIDNYEWPGGSDNKMRNSVLAEAKTLRAYFYLDLVSLFGRIKFYETNPITLEDSNDIPQVEDPKTVFDFIIKELEEAISGLPDAPKNKSKIGKSAARLLRARSAAYAAGYLNDKSYYNITLKETTELVDVSPDLLEYNDLFVSANEDIDEIILLRTYNPDYRNSWGNWYNNSIGGYCVTTPVKSLIDAYEYVDDVNEFLPYKNKDSRFYSSIYAPGSTLRDGYYNTIPNNTIKKDEKYFFNPDADYGSLQDREVLHGDELGDGSGGEWNKTSTGFTYKKYFSEPETWNTFNSYIIFRYAEAFLLRAEALLETGGSENEAKKMLKIIRDRAGNTNNIDDVVESFYNGNLIDLIRNEKRVEFANEGLRLYDIRRWGILLDVMNKPIGGIKYRDFSTGSPQEKVYTPAVRELYTDKDYWWPIPQSEIDLIPDFITQNNGW